jgi:RHS repeat-associated protein
MPSKSLKVRLRVRNCLLVFVLGLLVVGPVSPALAEATREQARVVLRLWEDLSGRLKSASRASQPSGLDTITDKEAQVDHFRLCPRHLKLYVGEQRRLVPMPLDTQRQPVNGILPTWSIADMTVATIDTSGKITAVVQGSTMVVVQAGRGRAHVSLDVVSGKRPNQTDQEWDAEHAHDCDGPEDAELNDPAPGPLDRAVASAFVGPVIVGRVEVPEGPAVETARQLADLGQLDRGLHGVPAAGRTVPTVHASAARYARASRPRVPAAVSVHTAAGSPASAMFQGSFLDGGNPDPAISSPATFISPGNVIGSPRFASIEVARGGAQSKMKNVLGSADYVFTAPVLALGGRGVGASLGLTFNSRLWSKDQASGMIFNLNKGWPTPGWSLGYGRLIPNFDNTARGDGLGTNANDYPGNWVLLEPDGTRTQLNGFWDFSSNVWHYISTDGRFLQSIFNQPPGTRNITYPDGTLVSFQLWNNRWLATDVETRNGDYIAITYRPKSSVPPFRWAIDFIEDSLGNFIRFNYYGDMNFPVTASGPQAFLATITAPDQVGLLDRTMVQLFYGTTTVSYNFQFLNTDPSSPPPANGSSMYVLTQIYYPTTGRGYGFSSFSSYGMPNRISVLNNINTPTGPGPGTEIAYTLYDYPSVGPQLTDSPKYTQRQEFWQGITGGQPAKYSYQLSSAGDNPSIDTITGPDSTVVTNTKDPVSTSFSYGMVTSSVVTNGGTTFQQANYTYTTDPNNRPQVGTVQVSTDGGSTSKTVYTYSDFARLNSVSEYGFFSTPQRITTYNYLSDRHHINAGLIRLVSSVTVADNSSGNPVTVAQTDFAYDETALTTYSGFSAPQHDPSYDASFTYRGNVTTVTRHIGIPSPTVARTNAYDIYGNVVSATVDCCQQQTFAFSSATGFAQPDSETDGSGTTLMTSWTYDPRLLLVLSVTNGDSQTTGYQYDSAWRLKQIQQPTGATTTTNFDKDANGNDQLSYTQQVNYTEGDGFTQKTITTKSFFDGAGRVIRSGTGAGASPTALDTVAVVYDSLGRPSQQSNPYSGDASGLGGSPVYTTNIYDALSRVTQVTLPGGNTLTTTFNGPTTTTHDQANRPMQYQVDGLGRLTNITEPAPASGTLSFVTTCGYDMLDNLTSVNKEGQTRTYQYDGLSRMTGQTTPEAGHVSFTYFDFGGVQSRTDARGVVTNYGYDGLNRLHTITYDLSHAQPGVASTGAITINYNSITQKALIASIVDGVGTETYSYDGFDRLTSKVRTIDGLSYTTSYPQYNTAYQVTQVQYPVTGRLLTIGYDSRGRLQQLSDTASTYLSNLSYNSAGQALGFSLGNGVTESFGYDANRLQMTSLVATQQGQPVGNLMNLTYNYNAPAGQLGVNTTAGNADQLVSAAGLIGGATESASYLYNSLRRMFAAAQTSNGVYAERGYGWDHWGNLTASFSDINRTMPIQTISVQQSGNVPTNRIQSVTTTTTVTYQYDSSGNVTYDGIHSYTYDAENRLVGVDMGSQNQTTYEYDYRNRRLKLVGPGGAVQEYVWEGNQVLGQYDGNGNNQVDYILAGGTFIAKVNFGTPYYFLRDRLSERLRLDGSGNIQGRMGHLPYGGDFGESGQQERHHFTTYDRDDNNAPTGTDYAVNRQYAFAVGRFMSPDPYNGSRRNPQSLNRYSYGNNDPINLSDPLGLTTCTVDGIVTDCGVAFMGLRSGAYSAAAGDYPLVSWDYRLNQFVYLTALADGRIGYGTANFQPTGADWVLTADLPEIVHLPPGMTLEDYVAYLNALKRDYDTNGTGSFYELPTFQLWKYAFTAPPLFKSTGFFSLSVSIGALVGIQGSITVDTHLQVFGGIGYAAGKNWVTPFGVSGMFGTYPGGATDSWNRQTGWGTTIYGGFGGGLQVNTSPGTYWLSNGFMTPQVGDSVQYTWGFNRKSP